MTGNVYFGVGVVTCILGLGLGLSKALVVLFASIYQNWLG